MQHSILNDSEIASSLLKRKEIYPDSVATAWWLDARRPRKRGIPKSLKDAIVRPETDQFNYNEDFNWRHALFNVIRGRGCCRGAIESRRVGVNAPRLGGLVGRARNVGTFE